MKRQPEKMALKVKKEVACFAQSVSSQIDVTWLIR